MEESIRQSRRGHLDMLGDGSDDDLRDGRFARARIPRAAKPTSRFPGATSSTRETTCINPTDAASLDVEDAMKEFLDIELKTHFAQQSDATLFVRILIADGIVSRKYYLGKLLV